MDLDAFVRATSLVELSEIEKVRHLAFYHHKADGLNEFSSASVSSWFGQLHLAAPNTTRLKSRLNASRSFIRGTTSGSYRLHATDLDELQSAYPGILSKSEAVTSGDALLPASLYQSSRGFVEALSKQINASYEYNIFDGCAVLMRRLVEVLLILSFEHHNIEGDISDANGNYLPLEQVVARAKTSQALKLSRNSRSFLDQFRMLGNFAAHKIYYTTRRGDIQGNAAEFRALIEELLYKSGIRR